MGSVLDGGVGDVQHAKDDDEMAANDDEGPSRDVRDQETGLYAPEAAAGTADNHQTRFDGSLKTHMAASCLGTHRKVGAAAGRSSEISRTFLLTFLAFLTSGILDVGLHLLTTLWTSFHSTTAHSVR